MNSPTMLVDPLGTAPRRGDPPTYSENCGFYSPPSCWTADWSNGGELDGGHVPPDLLGSGFLNNEGTVPCPGSCTGVNNDGLPTQFVATMTGSYDWRVAHPFGRCCRRVGHDSSQTRE
jgi:hypothetical protein